MWETWVQSLGWEAPLEESKATHSRIIAWRILWMEEPGELAESDMIPWGLKELDITEWLSVCVCVCIFLYISHHLHPFICWWALKLFHILTVNLSVISLRSEVKEIFTNNKIRATYLREFTWSPRESIAQEKLRGDGNSKGSDWISKNQDRGRGPAVRKSITFDTGSTVRVFQHPHSTHTTHIHLKREKRSQLYISQI